MHKLAFALSLLAGGLTAAPAALAADLWDAYQLALQNDAELRAAEANYRAAREAKPQAWSQYLPQISASASQTTSSSDGTQAEFVGGVGFVPVDFESESDSTNLSLSLRQTIFNWGTLQEIQQAGASVAQAEAEYRAAQQDVVLRVSESYFNLLAAQDRLGTAQANREAIGRQLEQTKKRFEVGLIAITDVQESQAAYDQAVAEEIAAERAVSSSREALRVIIGEYVGAPSLPRADMPLIAPNPQSAEDWVNQALAQNLSLVASRFALQVAQQTVDLRRAGHYPTLDLVASYSDRDQESDFIVSGSPNPTTRDQVTSDSISLQLNVPLFSGGGTQSQVREAAARATAAQADLQRTTRETEQQARDA